MVSSLVAQTLLALGIEVIDLGHSTTPTVEMAVPWEAAGAGIIITASHNPAEWNALKLLNDKGEFISASDGREFLSFLSEGKIRYASSEEVGRHFYKEGYIERHVSSILDLPLIKREAVRKRSFHLIVDCINSTGALALPPLLEKLGCTYELINDAVDGQFAHPPEPLPENVVELRRKVAESSADLGIALDPDVDRLALVCEDGSFFGEEYTLVAAADYVLSRRPGAAVSNLSSSRALRDLCREKGMAYYSSAVGEVNVVEKMKEVKAVIGGEGNGGVILPDLHYGRDALAGVALILSHLAETELSLSALKKKYPEYRMVKDKIALDDNLDLDELLSKLRAAYETEEINTLDGLKVDFEHSWVHLRRSNTEPIIRIYAEAQSEEDARHLVDRIKKQVRSMVS